MSYREKLTPPTHPVDVVLDTDAYNEIDDQFALAYLLRSKPHLVTKAIYAAPFHNHRSTSPEDGMEKSYDEILKLLDLLQEDVPVLKGSTTYLPDEQTPVDSPAARHLVQLAHEYSPENPLYVVAIGAITNVASAILMDTSICENIVIVWLGGNSLFSHSNKEFNLMQDIAAGRVVVGSSAPFVQLPCHGVVTQFALCEGELNQWFVGKNPVSDYLAKNTLAYMEAGLKEKFHTRAWSKVIWDVTAVGWLHSGRMTLMDQTIMPRRLPDYNHQYEPTTLDSEMAYIHYIHRDALLNHLIDTLNGEGK